MHHRETIAVVHLDHIRHNIDVVYERCQKPIIAILKANAYGHGAKVVANEIEKNPHISMLATATIDEAVELRENGIEKEILVLGSCNEKDIEDIQKYDITITIHSFDQIRMLQQNPLNHIVKVHMKLDTGMNRLGFKTREEFIQAYNLLSLIRFIDIQGVYTHYATADEQNSEKYNQQFNQFKEMIDDYSFEYIHAQNSAGSLYHQEDVTNVVRVGLALYGLEPNGSKETSLKQAMSLYTKVSAIHHLKEGETVSYGATYTASGDEIIATLPIGYADGIIRANQNRNVYVHGQLCPIVGRICMDQMMIKVDESVKIGRVVEIFGEHISLQDMAIELNTIPYEIICLISSRVPRVYFEETMLDES